MSKDILETIVKLVNNTEWPPSGQPTEKSLMLYEKGLDFLTSYRGHPEILIGALTIFCTTGVRSYAYAGAAYVLMAASYEQNNDYNIQGLQEAQKWLGAAQTLAHDQVEIDFLEAHLYIDWKYYDKARLILDYLTGHARPYYYIYMTEMQYWERQNDVDKVKFWYKKIMEEKHPPLRYTNALNLMAATYLRNELYSDAIATYQQLAKSDPKDPWLWHNMSIAYANLKRYEDAERCNENALGLMDFLAARQMRLNLRKLKRPRMTQAAIVCYNRGNSYFDQKDFGQAITAYAQAVKLEPAFDEAYTNRGLAYALTGDLKRAIVDYTKAIQINPDGFSAFFLRGKAYLKMKKKREAAADFEMILKFADDPKSIQSARDQLELLK